MKYIKNKVNQDNCLTIYLEGEINSLTSEEVENEILGVTNSETFDKLVINTIYHLLKIFMYIF